MAYTLFDAEGKLGLDATEMRRELRAARTDVQKTLKEIDGQRATADIKADIDDVEEKMRRANAMLEKFRKQRAEAKADVEVDQAVRKIQKLEAQMKRLDGKRSKLQVEAQVSQQINKDIKQVTASIGDLGNQTDKSIHPIEKLGKALHQARVTIGPLSLSLRALTIGLAATGPMVVNLAGSLTSLVGVLGTGLTGAAGLGGAALAGFGGLATGFITAIKANDKVFKPLTKDAKEFGKEWGKLTKTGATGFSKDLQGALGSVRTMLPGLAKQTNQTFDIMGQGAQRFARMLSSTEGKGNIDKIFGNANAALKPLLAGMTNLGQVGLRVFGSFSRYLPDIGKGFRSWTDGLLKSTQDTNRLDKGVDRLVRHAKLVGTFFLEAGRAVKDVFNVAANDGVKPVESMTNAMRDIQKWAKTPGAAEFFQAAREGSAKVVDALQQIIPIIAQWVRAMAPFSRAFLEIVIGAGKLTNALLDAVGGGQQLMSVLAGLYVLNKAVKWANALRAALTGAALVQVLPFGRGGKASKMPTPVPVPTGGGGGKEGRQTGNRFVQGFKSALRSTAGQIVAGRGLGKVAQSIAGRFKGTGGKIAAGMGLGAIGRAFRKALTPGALGAGLGRAIPIAGLLDIGRRAAGQIEKGVTERIDKLPEKVQPKVQKTWDIFKQFTPVGPLSDLNKMVDDPGKFFADYRSKVQGHINTVKGLFGVEIEGPRIKPPKDLKPLTELRREQMAQIKKPLVPTQTLVPKLKPGNFNREIASQMKQASKINTIAFQVKLSGDNVAQTALNRLRRTNLGRKVLAILARGGPQAQQILRRLQGSRIGRKVLSIIERGGKPAEKIMNALQNKQLRRKLLRILETGGKGTQRQLERILGIKLNPKKQNISETGGNKVQGLINAIKAAKLGNKSTTLSAEDRATATINGIIGMLNAIPRSITTTHRVNTQKGGVDLTGGGDARGGFGLGGTPVTEKVARQAASKPPLRPGGNIVREPRMLRQGSAVGEERRTEVVIATNPAYRRRNLGLFAAAGRMLGVSGFNQGGIEGFQIGGLPGGGGSFADMVGRIGGTRMAPWPKQNTKVARGKKYWRQTAARDRRKVQGGRWKGTHDWSLYNPRSEVGEAIGNANRWQATVKGLQTRESDLGREAQIRESAIREPESLIMKSGTNPDGSDAFVVNQPAIDKLVGDMKGVEAVYSLQWQVARELSEAIPKAKAAMTEAMRAMNATIRGHKKRLKTFRSALARQMARKKDKRNPREIRRLRGVIDETERRITKLGKMKGDATTTMGEYGDDAKDAGFRAREAFVTLTNLSADRAAIQGKAEGEAKDASAAGGGGGTNAPLQAGALGAARYDLLANFGSNFSPFPTGGGGAPASGAGNFASAMNGGFAAGGMASSGDMGSMRMLGQIMADPIVGAMNGAITGVGGGTGKTINVTNNYAGAPEDAHTWSQRQKWELSATGF